MDAGSPKTTFRGFTLLDLLCSLGLISILLGIAVPQLTASLPGLYLDQAARRLAGDVELSRVRAVARNTRVRVVIDLAENRYQIDSESEGRFTPEGGSRGLPSGVVFDAVSSTRVSGDHITITFQPRGNTADNATVALTGPTGAAKRILISPAGRVRIQ